MTDKEGKIVDDVTGRIEHRVRQINEWLSEVGSRCKEEQRHCEGGTPEREYWHYGYMVALRDVLNLLRNQGNSSQSPQIAHRT